MSILDETFNESKDIMKSPMNGTEKQDILNLLKEGEELITYTSQRKVVLILGNTGSGKSIFTALITGNDRNLTSIADETHKDKFIIRNNGNTDLTPYTRFPNLVLDSAMNTAFYDFPGFNSNRSAAEDISTTYFMKKIMNYADSVKLVFTTTYSPETGAVDKQDFVLLMENVVTLINNIKKFKDSIALIVTKVDYAHSKNIQPLSEQAFIENIAKFLETIKNEQTNEKAIQFIDGLLTKVDNDYRNIGILKRPQKSGSLRKELLKNKKLLEKIVKKNIQYCKYNNNDFNYYLSSNSKKNVPGLIAEINNDITFNIQDIGKEVEHFYQQQEKKLHNIEFLRDTLLLGWSIFKSTKQDLEKILKSDDVLKLLDKSMNNAHISIPDFNFQRIKNNIDYLKFLETIQSHVIKPRPGKWSRGLKNTVKYLNDSRKWYDFLIKLYDILTQYDVQKNVSKYTELINQQPSIIEKLNVLLNEVSDESIKSNYGIIKDVHLDDSKLYFLNKILNSALVDEMHSSCAYKTLTIQGRFVKLKDIEEAKCPQAKNITLFALDKVFIDSDLDKTEIQLLIIAPTWDVINKRKIILDGSYGGHWLKEQQDPGKPGEPGFAGGPGGIFIGIGKTFINIKNLSISLNGGDGGAGQDGAVGLKGIDGKMSTSMNDWVNTINTKDDVCKIDMMKLPYNEYVECIVSEGDCTDGGKGGDGGVGGKGGDPGYFQLLGPEQYSSIRVHNARGKTGAPGKGGVGGAAGSTGRIYKIYMEKQSEWFFLSHYYKNGWVKFHNETLRYMPGPTCVSGKPGADNTNHEDIENPKVMYVHKPYSIINSYKGYVREHLYENIKEKSLRTFLDYLENHKSMVDFYDTLGFVDELESLEKQFYKLSKYFSFLPFYQSLLQRIINHANKLQNNDSKKEIKVLYYLAAAIRSKINGIQNRNANQLIFKVPERLDNAISKIREKIKNLNNVESIEKYKNNYRNSMNSKIEEALNFVDKQITPDINEISQQIDKQLNVLINETISKRQEADGGMIDLLESQKKLQKSFVLNTVFSAAKMTSQLLSFAGPLGAAAGTAIGTGTMIAETFLKNDSDNSWIQNLTKLPKGIDNALSEVEKIIKNKQDLFKNQISDVETELKKLTDLPKTKNLSDIENKISEIKAVLNKKKSNERPFDLESVNNEQDMRKELSELLKEKINILKQEESKESLKTDRQLKVVKTMHDILSMTQIGVEFYNSVKNDADKFDEVSKAILQKQDEIDKYEAYEKTIHQIIIPICDEIHNNTKEVSNNIKNKSHVFLDVSKWRLKHDLLRLKSKIQTWTEDFTAGDGFIDFIQKLDAAMFLMIQMYDRVQDYKDKQEFADYIANINSQKFRDINIDDKDFLSAIDRLNRIIQSNIVLEEYENIMKAFGQYVYPFAHRYLENADLPSYDESKDIETLVNRIEDTFEILKQNLEDSSTTIREHQGIIHQAQFAYVKWAGVSKPFFVWTYNENKHAISKLLRGEEIVLHSDINKSTNKNAVKFSNVALRFRLSNRMSQRSFDTDLTNVLIKLTHLGNSHYRCDNKYHTIISDPVPFKFTLASNYINNNIPTNILNESVPLLSPYATWSMSIINDVGEASTLLSKYKNEPMNIELEGRGQYMEVNRPEVCNDDLDKYYSFEENLVETYNDDQYNKKNIEPFINSLNNSSRHKKEKKNYRRRRSLEKDMLIGDADKHVFSTSGTSGMKSSFINNMINLIGATLMSFDYLKPVNKISQWLTSYEKNTVKQDSFASENNRLATMKTFNIYPVNRNIENPMKMNLDYESPEVDGVLSNGVLLCNHSNLVLLDLVIRQKSRVKYEQRHLVFEKSLDSEYVHSLAYREYLPKNK